MNAQKKCPGRLAGHDRGQSNIQHVDYMTAAGWRQSPADLLLPRLDGVKQTGPGKWLARCPAHEDRHPSLGIRETEDGKLLLKCWAGCGVEAICAAVGLELPDLFPHPHSRDFNPATSRPKPPKFTAGELVQLAAFEAGIVAIAAGDLLAGVELSDSDRDRLQQAADTLQAIYAEVLP